MNQRRIPINSKRGQRGAAMTEYVVVTALVATVLLANPGVVQELVDALKRMYEAFTYALSRTIH